MNQRVKQIIDSVLLKIGRKAIENGLIDYATDPNQAKKYILSK